MNMNLALFSEFECSQIRGQLDVFEVIADTLAEQAAAESAVASTLPGDGSLFALRLTDAPAEGGALFGLGI